MKVLKINPIDKSIEQIEISPQELEKLPSRVFKTGHLAKKLPQFGYEYTVASVPQTEGEFRCCWCRERLFSGVSYLYRMEDGRFLACNIPLTTAKAIIHFGNDEINAPDYGGNQFYLHKAINECDVEFVRNFLDGHPDLKKHDILNYQITWYVHWSNPERNKLPLVSAYETKRFFCHTEEDVRKIDEIIELLQQHGARLDACSSITRE